MAIFKRRDKALKRSRAEKREWNEAHEAAMVSAQDVYDRQHAEGDMAVTTWDEGPFHVISAADPDRLAWEEYFDFMYQKGLDPWEGVKRFDKELKTR